MFSSFLMSVVVCNLPLVWGIWNVGRCLVAQNIPYPNAIRKFISVVTHLHYWPLSWTSWTHSIPFYPIFLNPFHHCKMSGSHGDELWVVFWSNAPCSLAQSGWRYRGIFYLYHHVHNLSNDGGSKHLWNIGKFLHYYKAQYPRRQSSLFQHYPNIYSCVCKVVCSLQFLRPNFAWVSHLLHPCYVSRPIHPPCFNRHNCVR
jgi:hypothetical protein